MTCFLIDSEDEWMDVIFNHVMLSLIEYLGPQGSLSALVSLIMHTRGVSGLFYLYRIRS